MPHTPKPFYKANRNTWYVEIDRVQISLGEHTGPPPKRKPPPRGRQKGDWDPPPAILAAFYKAMASTADKPPPPKKVSGPLVVTILEQFLDWCQTHKAPLTYDWYRQRLSAFGKTIDRHLAVSELKPFHVQEWADAHPEWSDSHKRGSIAAVQRAFRWAEKIGHVDKSPVRHVEGKPQPGKREQLIDPAAYAVILGHFSDSFRELIEMAWHTGARPQETIRIEARHCDLEQRRIVLPPGEAKGKKRYRVIYLNDTALALVRRKIEEQTDGPIFRNADGNPWTAWAVNDRFCRVQQALGRDAAPAIDPEEVKRFALTLAPTRVEKGKPMKKTEKDLLREARKKLRKKATARHGTKFCLYVFRHSADCRIMPTGFVA